MNIASRRTTTRTRLTASALTLSMLLLASCGGGKKEDSQVTETRMDDIDSLEGTISDDMINTDESTDEGPYDAAPAGDLKPKAKLEDKNKTEEAGPTKQEPVNTPPLTIDD